MNPAHFLLFFLIFIYYRKRKSMCESGVRGRGRGSQADSPLSEEPDGGFDPRTLRSRCEPKSRVRCLTD